MHSADRSVVAFENPMYDASGAPEAEVAGTDASEGLYDEPAVFSGQQLTVADQAGGYLDIGPRD